MQLVDAAATAESAGATLVFAAIRALATTPPSPPWPPLSLAVLRPRRCFAAMASLASLMLSCFRHVLGLVKSLCVSLYGPDVPEHSKVYVLFDSS